MNTLAPTFPVNEFLVNAHLVALRPTDKGQMIPPRFEYLGCICNPRHELFRALRVVGEERPWQWYKAEALELAWFIQRFDKSELTAKRIDTLLNNSGQTWRVRLALVCEVFRARLAPLA